MSWKDNLLPASFNGVQFEVISTNDPIERTKVIQQYPFTNGANIIDMGENARQITMVAVFYGDDYETAMDNFLDAINVGSTYELIHPVFGSMQAQFWRAGLPHRAERPNYCEITVDFLRDQVDMPLFASTLPTSQVDAINSSADDVLDASQAQLVTDMGVSLNLPSLLKNTLIANLQGVVGSVGTIIGQIAGAAAWVASGADYLTDAAAFFTDVTSGMVVCVQGIYAGMDLTQAYTGASSTTQTGVSAVIDGATGVVATGSIATAAGATSAATFQGFNYVGTTTSSYSPGTLAAVWKAPLATLTQPLLVVPSSTQSSTPTGPYITSGSAQTQPFLTAHLSIQASVAVAAAAAQVFSLALADPLLTPDDIETVSNDTRTNIMNTITLVQQTWPDIVASRPITEPLKALALSVATAAAVLIKEKPPLITKTVEVPGNLLLIAFLWYGDYTRADELLRLNPSIINPNFITPGTTLSCYAS